MLVVESSRSSLFKYQSILINIFTPVHYKIVGTFSTGFLIRVKRDFGQLIILISSLSKKLFANTYRAGMLLLYLPITVLK